MSVEKAAETQVVEKIKEDGTDLEGRVPGVQTEESAETGRDPGAEANAEAAAVTTEETAVAEAPVEGAVEAPAAEGLEGVVAPAAEATVEAPAAEADQVVFESIEITGDLRAARKALKDVATVERSDDFLLVRYDESKRDEVLGSLSNHVKNIDLHLVNEDAGKSLFRVLSESGFKDDAITTMSVIFEASVSERDRAREVSFESRVAREVQTRLDEELAAFDARVDEGVNEFKAKFIAENAATLASAARVAQAETILESLKTALEGAGLRVDENKEIAYTELAARVEGLEKAANEAAEAHAAALAEKDAALVAVHEEAAALKRDALISQISESHKLSMNQRDRLVTMLEGVGFDAVEEKAKILVESFFSGKTAKAGAAQGSAATSDVLLSEESGIVAAPKADPVTQTLRRMNHRLS